MKHGLALADLYHGFRALNPRAFEPVLSGTSFKGQLAYKIMKSILTQFTASVN
jgi:hypothetical protein